MKAAVLYGPGDMRLVDITAPVPDTGEVLIQVKEVGICASDVHWFREGRIGDQAMQGPLILGHEFSGVVAGVGPGVTRVKTGDRVAVEPAMSCLKCDMCAEGNYNVCRKIRFAGTFPTDGAFREFLVWPERFMEKVPDGVTMGEAAMMEPLAVGMYAVGRAPDIRGKHIGVLGAGAIGLSVLQCAITAGCSDAFVTDLIPDRLARARTLGATSTFDADDGNIVSAVKDAMGCEPDVVFEATGENVAVRQATELVRPLGTVVVIGIPYDDDMVVSASVVRRKGLTLRLIRRSNETLKHCIDSVAEGKLNVSAYITHKFPLERILEGFAVAGERRDGALRVVVQIS